jgi:hypothetical protein
MPKMPNTYMQYMQTRHQNRSFGLFDGLLEMDGLNWFTKGSISHLRAIMIFLDHIFFFNVHRLSNYTSCRFINDEREIDKENYAGYSIWKKLVSQSTDTHIMMCPIMSYRF